MEFAVRPRRVVGLLTFALVAGSIGPVGCGTGGEGTVRVSRAEVANRPIVPPGLKGKAAKRAAEPDGRPRGRIGA
jgi:hypothetical protein